MKPLYDNDCPHCHFLGQVEGDYEGVEDAYFCEQIKYHFTSAVTRMLGSGLLLKDGNTVGSNRGRGGTLSFFADRQHSKHYVTPNYHSLTILAYRAGLIDKLTADRICR